jgi:hypothetical protein
MAFGRYGGGESMRIDSSGNLLVGKSSSAINTDGVELLNSGRMFLTTTSLAHVIRRKSTDGELVEFQKDGTSVGSIGARGGDVYLETGNTGIRMYDASNAIIPVGSTGVSRDAAIDLGLGPNLRFKDLYLSGNINLSASSQINSSTAFYLDSDIIHFRRNNETESARIDSSGNLLVGKTSSGLNTAGFEVASSGRTRLTRDGNNVVEVNRKTSDGSLVTFSKDATTVGSISVTSSATAFNTSSDQRLKENIVDAPSASNDIDAIQVRSFDWKADGSHQKYGMVAQELQGVAPEAVSGDADSEEMMGVDYSKLVPMLVKEIQSLRARVAQLEGEA